MDGISKSLTEAAARVGATRLSLAVGVFDGVHCGHRKVIDTLCAEARRNGSMPVVVTFSPHPREVLAPACAPQLLTTPCQQRRVLRDLGCADVVFLPFSRKLAELSPKAFIEEYICVSGLDIALVCVGSAWRFGRRGSGTAAVLTDLGCEFGFEVIPVRELLAGDEPVSSTRIREAVSEGQMEKAEELLGRPYAIESEVRRGRGLGGELFSCPTANLSDSRVVLPPHGVYAAWAAVDPDKANAGRLLPGIVYVGAAPTVVQNAEPLLELHLFDINENLYGRRIEVRFAGFLRPDRVFPGPDALREQIALDISQAKELLRSHGEHTKHSVRIHRPQVR